MRTWLVWLMVWGWGGAVESAQITVQKGAINPDQLMEDVLKAIPSLLGDVLPSGEREEPSLRVTFTSEVIRLEFPDALDPAQVEAVVAAAREQVRARP